MAWWYTQWADEDEWERYLADRYASEALRAAFRHLGQRLRSR